MIRCYTITLSKTPLQSIDVRCKRKVWKFITTTANDSNNECNKSLSLPHSPPAFQIQLVQSGTLFTFDSFCMQFFFTVAYYCRVLTECTFVTSLHSMLVCISVLIYVEHRFVPNASVLLKGEKKNVRERNIIIHELLLILHARFFFVLFFFVNFVRLRLVYKDIIFHTVVPTKQDYPLVHARFLVNNNKKLSHIFAYCNIMKAHYTCNATIMWSFSDNRAVFWPL